MGCRKVSNAKGAEQLEGLSSRVLLAVALVSAVLVRCLPWRNFVNPQGGFHFYSIDSYDHLRRITLGVNLFPSLANFDYYAAFPQGLGQIWAPGFDYMLSAICLLAGGSKEVIETICFFFNPFAAALAVVFIFLIARAVFRSQLAGGVAALLLALHPAYIVYSRPMTFDHHAVEPLVALLLFSLPLLERRGRLHLGGMALAVFCMLLAIILWRGSTIYWGLAFVSAFCRVLVSDSRPLSIAYSLVFWVVALLLAIYCLLDPWGGARQLSFGVISWFHVCMLAGWASVLLLFGLCRSRQLFWMWLAGGAVLALVAVLTGPLAGMVKQVVGGLSFVRGGGDPWLDSISELQGVFRLGARHNFWYSASYLTFFWVLAPVAVWLGFRQWNRGGRTDSLLLNFMLWSPVLAMGLVIRYSHIAGLFMSLAGGGLFAELWGRFSGRRSRWLLASAFLLALLPGIPHYREAMTFDLPDHMRYGLYGEHGLLEWLRQKTPVTSYWANPVQPPEYGVLARWSFSAHIYQVAQRPALSTAFGWETHGFYQEAGFWVTEEEATALRIARESKIRYVVVRAVHGLKTDYDLVVQGQERGALPANIVAPEFRPKKTMHTRLMQGDGSMMTLGDDMLPALESFRIVYEGNYLLTKEDGTPTDLSYYKVFEVVNGAVITGKVARADSVILALELQTTRQRTMTYLSRVYADRDGTFKVRVPYATTGLQGDTRPLGDYKVYVGREMKGSVAVSEADVVNGGTVNFH